MVAAQCIKFISDIIHAIKTVFHEGKGNLIMHYKKVTIGKNLGFPFKCQLLYYMYIGYTVESFSFVGGGGGVSMFVGSQT